MHLQLQPAPLATPIAQSARHALDMRTPRRLPNLIPARRDPIKPPSRTPPLFRSNFGLIRFRVILDPCMYMTWGSEVIYTYMDQE